MKWPYWNFSKWGFHAALPESVRKDGVRWGHGTKISRWLIYQITLAMGLRSRARGAPLANRNHYWCSAAKTWGLGEVKGGNWSQTWLRVLFLSAVCNNLSTPLLQHWCRNQITMINFICDMSFCSTNSATGRICYKMCHWFSLSLVQKNNNLTYLKWNTRWGTTCRTRRRLRIRMTTVAMVNGWLLSFW